MKFDGLIISNNHKPYYNLALEEAILEEDLNLIMIWRNNPSVIIGRHQNTYKEVDHDYIKKEHIHVVRRLTGGGAVYHDLNNINISFIFDVHDFDNQIEYCSNTILWFLKEYGIEAYRTGRNDICIEYKDVKCKISGCAMMQRGNKGLYHATLLFDTDVNKMSRALTPGIPKLRANGTDSVRARVVNIKDVTDIWKDIEQFETDLIKYFQVFAGKINFRSSKINDYMESRYMNDEWNYGRNPESSIVSERKFIIGTVEMSLSIKGGIIKECKFTGDYIDPYPIMEVADALSGVKYTREHVEQTVKKFDCIRLFGEEYSKVVEFVMKGK